ncbi:hypothetical protein OBBRIDRAFT_793845, partial [Obba rivulosa]
MPHRSPAPAKGDGGTLQAPGQGPSASVSTLGGRRPSLTPTRAAELEQLFEGLGVPPAPEAPANNGEVDEDDDEGDEDASEDDDVGSDIDSPESTPLPAHEHEIKKALQSMQEISDKLRGQYFKVRKMYQEMRKMKKKVENFVKFVDQEKAMRIRMDAYIRNWTSIEPDWTIDEFYVNMAPHLLVSIGDTGDDESDGGQENTQSSRMDGIRDVANGQPASVQPLESFVTRPLPLLSVDPPPDKDALRPPFSKLY